MLNTCKVAREESSFNVRHDAVAEIVSLLSISTLPTAKLYADLGSYLLVEVTICFESSFQQTAERRQLTYEDVMSGAKLAGYSGRVITLEVGSRGIISQIVFSHLKSEVNIRKQDCPATHMAMVHTHDNTFLTMIGGLYICTWMIASALEMISQVHSLLSQCTSRHQCTHREYTEMQASQCTPYRPSVLEGISALCMRHLSAHPIIPVHQQASQCTPNRLLAARLVHW